MGTHLFASLLFGWAEQWELEFFRAAAIQVNATLKHFWSEIGMDLVDFKIEFGRHYSNDEVRIVLADEISPDSCRLWDVETNEKLDKDRFRRDLGNIPEAYQEVARRLGILAEGAPGDVKGPKVIQ